MIIAQNTTVLLVTLDSGKVPSYPLLLREESSIALRTIGPLSVG